MIEEKEIRSGNWFHHNEEWSNQSEGKGAHDFQFDSIHWYWMHEGCLSLDNIEPIPLSEEWFVKLGFKNISGNENYEYWTIGENGYIAGEDLFHAKRQVGNENLFFINIRYSFKYVHEVQNIYHSLTGQELEIK